MDPKELMKKLEVAIAELETLEKSVAECKEDEVEAVQEAITEKEKEVGVLEKELEDAVEKAEKRNKVKSILARAGELSKTDTTGKTLGNENVVPAQPEDVVQKQIDQLNICHKYLTGDPKEVKLSGEEMKLVKPDGEAFKAGANGVKLPLCTTLKMFGVKWARSVGYSPAEISVAMKASTMVSSNDALGGYTVPEDFRNTLLDLPVEEAHILPRATVIPSSTGEVTIPKAKQTDSDEYGGMAGAWISEGGAKTKSDTQFEQVKISAHEYAMYTQVSIRLLARSAIAMENWIVTRGRQKCLDALDAAFINGDGSGKPTGILQTAGIRTIARQTADAVTWRDIVRLKRALKPYHRAGGTFIMDDTVGGYLEETKDNEGRTLFTASVANGLVDRLAGYPFVESTRTPDLGTSGDIFFGDLREYYVPMEQDVVAKRSDDYDIVHNLATIVIFVVVGGELVQPRVVAELGDVHGS